LLDMLVAMPTAWVRLLLMDGVLLLAESPPWMGVEGLPLPPSVALSRAPALPRS
jgi:hypothetical protein